MANKTRDYDGNQIFTAREVESTIVYPAQVRKKSAAKELALGLQDITTRVLGYYGAPIVALVEYIRGGRKAYEEFKFDLTSEYAHPAYAADAKKASTVAAASAICLATMPISIAKLHEVLIDYDPWKDKKVYKNAIDLSQPFEERLNELAKKIPSSELLEVNAENLKLQQTAIHR